MRAGHRSLAALLLAGILAALTVAPAQAAGYRYWSFWEGQGKDWAYATQGPATARPADGDTIGFRFAVSEDAKNAAKPRTAPDFGAVCDRTPAKDGDKRVAVVLDFGTPADAPAGETPPPARTACARVGEDAGAGEALAAAAKPLRYNSAALLCAIAGYPKSGCGEQVSGRKNTESTKPEATSSDSSGGPSAGLIGGIAAVVVLGAAGVWQARRRKRG
ncbi:SCO2322 family protein [Streptomyces sp. NPDC020379]|uniref:SCO2322 family protein n=1 Tax=Streptomyces sp. NPDC020379 TaxID=3365071 RepID=UPI0037A7CE4B